MGSLISRSLRAGVWGDLALAVRREEVVRDRVALTGRVVTVEVDRALPVDVRGRLVPIEVSEDRRRAVVSRMYEAVSFSMSSSDGSPSNWTRRPTLRRSGQKVDDRAGRPRMPSELLGRGLEVSTPQLLGLDVVP
jgi:hypothetical protein